MTNNQPTADLSGPSGFALAGVEVHPESLLLVVNGDRRRIEPRVMDLLVYGSSRAGQLLSKQQIMRDIWADAPVVPEALQRVVSSLRKAIGDRPDDPVFVETISKKGYRFLLSPEPLPGEKTIKLTEKSVHLSPLHLIIAVLVLATIVWIAVSNFGQGDIWAPKADERSDGQVEHNSPPPEAGD